MLLQKQIKEMKKYRGFNDADLKYYELPGAHHTLEATVTLLVIVLQIHTNL